MTRLRRWIFTSGMFVVVIGMFSVVELAVRIFYRHKRVDVEQLLYATGPLESYGEELGWSLNPSVVQQIRTGFGDLVTYRTDMRGFRVEEDRESSRTEIDVLFVGDSVTFGTSANKSFPLEFGRISQLKCINAGVPGYGTDQAFLMTKKVFETMGIRPREVVYGFYWNDIANNTSRVGTDFDKRFIVHKPILNRESKIYERAEVEKNDLTRKYASPTFLEALQRILFHSKFLMATWRVVQYNRLLHQQHRPLPKFDDVAKSYLRENMDQFVTFVRSHQLKFAVLHIEGGHADLEAQISAWLEAYCREKRVQYIRPTLTKEDYLPTDFHLSEQGAVSVATALWKQLQ